jgi:hypothetical protein
MKKLFVVAVVSLLSTTVAHAGNHVGQCVFPKTVIKAGRMEFKQPVYLTSSPTATDKTQLTEFSGFSVKAESNGYVQLVTVPDYNQPNPMKGAGKVVGWAKLSDFKVQDARNCN